MSLKSGPKVPMMEQVRNSWIVLKQKKKCKKTQRQASIWHCIFSRAKATKFRRWRICCLFSFPSSSAKLSPSCLPHWVTRVAVVLHNVKTSGLSPLVSRFAIDMILMCAGNPLLNASVLPADPGWPSASLLYVFDVFIYYNCLSAMFQRNVISKLTYVRLNLYLQLVRTCVLVSRLCKPTNLILGQRWTENQLLTDANIPDTSWTRLQASKFSWNLPRRKLYTVTRTTHLHQLSCQNAQDSNGQRPCGGERHGFLVHFRYYFTHYGVLPPCFSFPRNIWYIGYWWEPHFVYHR